MKQLIFLLFFIIIIIAINSHINKNKEHFDFDYTGKTELLKEEPKWATKYECAKYQECSVKEVPDMQTAENDDICRGYINPGCKYNNIIKASTPPPPGPPKKYTFFDAMKEHDGFIGGIKWILGMLPPYQDGKTLLAWEASKPATKMCVSNQKHTPKGTIDVKCGACPGKGQCASDLGGFCNIHEDCLNYGPGGVSCCQGVCKKEQPCKPGKLGDMCKVATDCEGVGPSTKGATTEQSGPNKGRRVRQVVCCKNDGTPPIAGTYKGNQCMVPGISSNAFPPLWIPTPFGYCPNDETGMSKFEKDLGKPCNVATDCLGWGIGCNNLTGECNQKTLCCDYDGKGKKCTANPEGNNVCKWKDGTWLAAGDAENYKNICQSGERYKQGLDVFCGKTPKKKLGGKCSKDEDCDNFGPGPNQSACCGGICKQKEVRKTWGGGVGYCPQKTGEVCKTDEECKGPIRLDKNPSGCCGGVCKMKVKDWIGEWYCPNECVSKAGGPRGRCDPNTNDRYRNLKSAECKPTDFGRYIEYMRKDKKIDLDKICSNNENNNGKYNCNFSEPDFLKACEEDDDNEYCWTRETFLKKLKETRDKILKLKKVIKLEEPAKKDYSNRSSDGKGYKEKELTPAQKRSKEILDAQQNRASEGLIETFEDNEETKSTESTTSTEKVEELNSENVESNFQDMGNLVVKRTVNYYTGSQREYSKNEKEYIKLKEIYDKLFNIYQLFIQNKDKDKINLSFCQWTGREPSRCVPTVHTVEIKDEIKDDKTNFYEFCKNQTNSTCESSNWFGIKYLCKLQDNSKIKDNKTNPYQCKPIKDNSDGNYPENINVKGFEETLEYTDVADFCSTGNKSNCDNLLYKDGKTKLCKYDEKNYIDLTNKYNPEKDNYKDDYGICKPNMSIDFSCKEYNNSPQLCDGKTNITNAKSCKFQKDSISKLKGRINRLPVPRKEYDESPIGLCVGKLPLDNADCAIFDNYKYGCITRRNLNNTTTPRCNYKTDAASQEIAKKRPKMAFIQKGYCKGNTAFDDATCGRIKLPIDCKNKKNLLDIPECTWVRDTPWFLKQKGVCRGNAAVDQPYCEKITDKSACIDNKNFAGVLNCRWGDKSLSQSEKQARKQAEEQYLRENPGDKSFIESIKKDQEFAKKNAETAGRCKGNTLFDTPCESIRTRSACVNKKNLVGVNMCQWNSGI